MVPIPGAVGVAGCAFTGTEVGGEIQVGFVVLLTKIICETPADTPANVTEVCHAPPSILYCKVTPNGADTTMVPVGTEQVGCTVTLAVAAAGGVGAAFTLTVVAVEIQLGSAVLLTLIL